MKKNCGFSWVFLWFGQFWEFIEDIYLSYKYVECRYISSRKDYHFNKPRFYLWKSRGRWTGDVLWVLLKVIYVLQQSLSFLKTMFASPLEDFQEFIQERLSLKFIATKVLSCWTGNILLSYRYELRQRRQFVIFCRLLVLHRTKHTGRLIIHSAFHGVFDLGELLMSCWSEGAETGWPSFFMKIWSDADIHLLFSPIHLCFIGRSKFGVESGWAWFKGSSPESIVFGRTQLPEWLESP